jgi:UDP-N-acetylmuramoylalanine--D-glutamate ligase
MAQMRPSTVVLLGLGVEADAAIRHFAGKADVFAFDDDAEKAKARLGPGAGLLPTIEALAAFTEAHPAQNQLWLRAPSLPPGHPAIQLAERRGIGVTTFTSYWMALHRDAVLATITGTKGKSTTTALCGEILNAAGLDVKVGGNLGVVPEFTAGEKWVLELSSYQLHDLVAAAPVHAVTSIYSEHLDWHGSKQAYVEAKLRPIRLSAETTLVLPRELSNLAEDAPNRRVYVEDVVPAEGEKVGLIARGRRFEIALEGAAAARFAQDRILSGNFRAALAVALTAADVDAEALAAAAARAWTEWRGLPSRQDMLGVYAGRLWVDDALATIPQATLAALERWRGKPIRLVIGGKNRDQDFSQFIRYVAENPDVHIYGYSEAGRIVRSLGSERLRLAETFEDALSQAFGESAPGDVILFSPAGATPEKGQSYRTRSSTFRAFALKAAEA